MGFLSRVFRILLDAAVVFAILCFVPGGIPKGEFGNIILEPTLPREGALAPNTHLDKAVRLFEHRFIGPEAVAYRGKTNEIFVSMHGGSIVKVFSENYSKYKEVARIGPGCDGFWDERNCGRPLGIRFANDGKLLVADGYLGIFKVDVDTGEKEQLLDPSVPINGATPHLIDDLDEDKEGNIYWTDASSTFDLSEGAMESLVGPTGRFVKMDTAGNNVVLIDKLSFPNGVQLSPEEDFVLVCESFTSKVWRYWLKGPKAGTHDVFVAGLPGYPDNLRSKPGGGYFINIVSVKDPSKPDYLSNLAWMPWLRRGIARIFFVAKKILECMRYVYDCRETNVIPYMLLSTETPAKLTTGNRTMVVIADEEGNIVSSLQSTTGNVKLISHTEEVEDRLFFGSPYNEYLGMIKLEDIEGYGYTPKPKSEEKLVYDGTAPIEMFLGDKPVDEWPENQKDEL